MKRIFLQALIFFMVAHCKLSGQFNTLIRVSKESKELLSTSSDSEREKMLDKSSDKKKWRLKKITTKSDLKKEIDSLRMMILEINKSKPHAEKFEFKRIEDSLMILIKNKIQSLTPVDSKSEKMNAPTIIETIIKKDYNSQFKMPLQNMLVITSSFGNRSHPISKSFRLHNGVDLKANYESVFAVLDGYVTQAGWDQGGGGNYIKVRHTDSYVTSYLHLSEIYYRAGEFVRAGYVIGKSGNTGNSTGPHLHFSVSEKGKFINPIGFLNNLIKANNLFTKYYER